MLRLPAAGLGLKAVPLMPQPRLTEGTQPLFNGCQKPLRPKALVLALGLWSIAEWVKGVVPGTNWVSG